MKQKSVVMLNEVTNEEYVYTTILIGTISIIAVKEVQLTQKMKLFGTHLSKTVTITATKIQSRGAMVETHYVKETPEEIYKLINSTN